MKRLDYEGVVLLTQRLITFFKTNMPKVVMNCHETCPFNERCNAVACYRHPDDALCFTGYEAYDMVVAHEYGHKLHHDWYPERCTGSDPECEKHANAIANWWSKGGPTFKCQVCNYEVADLNFETVKCPQCDSLYRNIGGTINPPPVITPQEVAAAIGVGAISVFTSWIMGKVLRRIGSRVR